VVELNFLVFMSSPRIFVGDPYLPQTCGDRLWVPAYNPQMKVCLIITLGNEEEIHDDRRIMVNQVDNEQTQVYDLEIYF
jgi:hypothetical protein